MGIVDATARTDGASRGHDTGRTGISERDGEPRIVRGVAQDLESIGDQFTTGFKGADRIREKRPLVTKHFQLHPVLPGVVDLLEQFPAQAGDANGILRGEAPCGVRKNGDAVGVDEFKQRASVRVDQSFSSHRDGHAVRTTGVDGRLHRLVVGVFFPFPPPVCWRGSGHRS